MDNKDLQNLLDSLDEGPLGKPQVYWDNLTKLELAKAILAKDKSYAKRAHDKVDWKKVNSAKDNFAIHAHRAQKVFAWKADTGELVGEYRSMSEAARQLNVYQGNIASALDNGRLRKGYRFSTKNKQPIPYIK